MYTPSLPILHVAVIVMAARVTVAPLRTCVPALPWCPLGQYSGYHGEDYTRHSFASAP